MTPTPEEPPSGDPERDDTGRSPDQADAPLRGWIDPEDRLWRHPSELVAGTALAPGGPSTGVHHGRIMILVGAAAAVAAVVWTVILLSPASDRPLSSSSAGAGAGADAPLTTLAGQRDSIPTVAEAAGQSMVELRADGADGDTSLVGVAVAEGGLVATMADGLSGLHSLYMVGPDGRLMRATVVAIDPTSDIALVNVPDDVPVAPFSDDMALSAGSPDIVLSLDAGTGSTPALRDTPGSVITVDQAIGSGPADGMPDITSTATGATGATEESGDPLLNSDGSVIGFLYDGGSDPSASAPTFLPTALVLGVADDLRSSGRVAHGWLGVEGATATGTLGAQVVKVEAGSPAAGRLQPGEVITGIGDVPIRTMADLRARLYVMAPSTTVALLVEDGTTAQVVDVTLGASP